MSFYHLSIEIQETQNKIKYIFQYDLEKQFIFEKIIGPFTKQTNFLVDGYFLNSANIKRLKICKSERNAQSIVESIRWEYHRIGLVGPVSKKDIFNEEEVMDVTQELFDELSETLHIFEDKESLTLLKKNVFIVHGKDHNCVEQVENFVRMIGLNPIVLFKEADGGLTIIEKIEKNVKNSCYGLVLYTPCDLGKLNDESAYYAPRARQNVIFEHGYLMGKLGRNNVCALVTDENIEKPGDISGMVYCYFDPDGLWKYKIAQNMKNEGIDIDLNKIK